MSRLALVLLVVSSACKTDNQPKPAPAPAPEAPKPAPVKPPEPPVKRPDPTPPPEAAKPTDAELEAKSFTMVEKMGDLFIADAKDCDKLAIDLKAFITENKPMMLQLSEMERRQTPEERTAYNQRTKERQDATMKRIQPAVDACKANPNVQAAMAEIPE